LFMISVGMLVDPALLFSDSQTLQRAAGFTLAVVAGKATAAAITGRAFGWRRAEIGALFSLSVAQAAATLAAVFVGFEIGLLEDSTVNAVILVILVTCVLSSIAGNAVAARLPQPPTRVDRLGKRVIVPMSTPDGTDQAIVFASALAAADTGTVLPLTVLDLRTSPTEVRQLREQMVTGVERTVLARGADARGEVRLDSSPGAGVLHAAVEQDATCIVMGWKGWATRRESFFGEHVDALLLGSPVPALVVRSTASGLVGAGRHVVLALDDSDLRPDGRPGALIAAAAAERIATAMKLPIVICRASDQLPSDLVKGQIVERVVTGDGGDIIELLQDNTRAGDIVIKGLPTTEARLGSQFARLLRSLGGRTFIAASPTRVGNAMQPPI
jgi:nucleotide-binding universal stress UspA family protein